MVARNKIRIFELFLEKEAYPKAINKLLDISKQYPDINYIDFGGGLGIPYDRENESSFPLEDFSKDFTFLLNQWMEETGRKPTFAIEPGRFLVARKTWRGGGTGN